MTALADKNNGTGEYKDSKNAVTKTYHTLKDLISSKFKKDSLENADELNNVTCLSQQQQQQGLQFPQGQATATGPEDFRSPYSALPAHMRQIPSMNQSQNSPAWQQQGASLSQQPTPTPSSHLNQSQRNYAGGAAQAQAMNGGGTPAQQRAASQPQLNVPFERRGSQNNLLEHHQQQSQHMNERRGSLANIDVTDSDDGGFNTKARRPVTMYQVQPQQHTPSPTQHLQSQSRQSPQVFQPNTNFQSAYASTLAQNYQQQQQFQQYQNVAKMDGNKQQQTDNSAPMLPNRQDIIRSSFQRQEMGSNTPDSLNLAPPPQQQQRPPELPMKPSQLKQQTDLKQQQQQQQPGSAASSDYDKSGNQSSNVDSGRGSAAYSSGRKGGMNGGITGGVVGGLANHDTSPENSDSPIRVLKDTDSEWVDIVDAELRNILEPGMQSMTLRPESTISGSVSSMSPPLPSNSPNEHQHRYKPNQMAAKDKQEYGTDSYNRPNRTSGPIGPSRAGWPGSTVQKQQRGGGSSKKQEQSLLKRHCEWT